MFCSTATRGGTTKPPGQGCAPTPRQRLTNREKFRAPFTVSDGARHSVRASRTPSDATLKTAEMLYWCGFAVIY